MSNKDKQSNFSGEDPYQVLGRIGTMTPRPWLSAVIPVNRLASSGRGLQYRNSISRKLEKRPQKGPTECASLFTYTSELALNSYTTRWGLPQLTYQILCAVLGALEMVLILTSMGLIHCKRAEFNFLGLSIYILTVSGLLDHPNPRSHSLAPWFGATWQHHACISHLSCFVLLHVWLIVDQWIPSHHCFGYLHQSKPYVNRTK